MQDLKKREFIASLLKAGAFMSLFPIAGSQLQSPSSESHSGRLQFEAMAEDFRSNTWFWLENRYTFSEASTPTDSDWKVFLNENRAEIERVIKDRFREVCQLWENYYSEEDLVQLHAFFSSPVGQKVIRQMTPEWQNRNLEAAKEFLQRIDSIQNRSRTLA